MTDYVNGYSGTVFGPDDNLTREQMAALVARFTDYMGIELTSVTDVSYSDASSIGDWAADSVEIVTAPPSCRAAMARSVPKTRR